MKRHSRLLWGTGMLVVVALLCLGVEVTFAVWHKLEDPQFAVDERQICVNGLVMGVAHTYDGDLVTNIIAVEVQKAGGVTFASTTLHLTGPSIPNINGTNFKYSGELTLTWGALSPGTALTVLLTDVVSDPPQVAEIHLTVNDCRVGESTGNASVPAPTPRYVPPDDRQNADPLASAAVYCRAGGIEVWAIDTDGHGHLAFLATWDQINRVGIPATNTLIASGMGVRLYRLTTGEFQINANPRAPASQLSGGGGSAVVPGGSITYIVQPGDNLFRIALRFHSTVAAIAQANNIADPTRIYVGQQLVIPTGGSAPSSVPDIPAAGPEYVFIWSGCVP